MGYEKLLFIVILFIFLPRSQAFDNHVWGHATFFFLFSGQNNIIGIFYFISWNFYYLVIPVPESFTGGYVLFLNAERPIHPFSILGVVLEHLSTLLFYLYLYLYLLFPFMLYLYFWFARRIWNKNNFLVLINYSDSDADSVVSRNLRRGFCSLVVESQVNIFPMHENYEEYFTW